MINVIKTRKDQILIIIIHFFNIICKAGFFEIQLLFLIYKYKYIKRMKNLNIFSLVTEYENAKSGGGIK